MVESLIAQQNAACLCSFLVPQPITPPYLTHLFNNGEHPGFIVVVPIGPDTQVYFFLEGVRFVRGGKLEDTVWGGRRVISCFRFKQIMCYTCLGEREGHPAKFLPGCLV